MITLQNALAALLPNTKVLIINDQIVKWKDEREQPSQEVIDQKIAELEAEEPMRLLREERDQRLAATDWRATVDYPGNDKQLWLDYRQALRDITLQDSNNIIWPSEPA